ncbi:MAG: SUMF1/EgtB/PvdO family nonheme iron enzyme [bacterium]|nr:SUMF1/EgtB/PvdO family nonheme iron enzyme [bacterium]
MKRPGFFFCLGQKMLDLNSLKSIEYTYNNNGGIKVKNIIVLLIVVAAIFIGCSKNPASTATTGTISGTVSKLADSTAIAGATIVTTPATSTATSDSNGQYAITGVAAGAYAVTASKSGYNNNTINVTVSAGNVTFGNITLADTVPGNNPPNAPSNLFPANTATGISITPTLKWLCTDSNYGDTLKYDIYFGTTNPPITLISIEQIADSFAQSGLAYSSIYYWKIIAKDNHGATTIGPVWNFTTVAEPIVWITIPAGNFNMGSLNTDPDALTDEKPQHTVYLDAYQISKYEITNSQYKAFMDAGGYTNSNYWTTDGWTWRTNNSIIEPAYWTSGSYNSGSAFPNHPVGGISWYEAYAFCQWAIGHLPTEAQWEKAARETDARYYPWGSTWDASKCNSYYNTSPDTFTYSSPVGFFSTGTSPYGVYDMAGNIWEWCNDWYSSTYYSTSPSSNPTGPITGSSRVIRGDGYNLSAGKYRIAYRGNDGPDYRNNYYGFRVAKQ